MAGGGKGKARKARRAPRAPKAGGDIFDFARHAGGKRARDEAAPRGGKKARARPPAAAEAGRAAAPATLDEALAGAGPGMPRRVLAWLLHPVTVEEFEEQYWERRPLVIRRPARGRERVLTVRRFSPAEREAAAAAGEEPEPCVRDRDEDGTDGAPRGAYNYHEGLYTIKGDVEAMVRDEDIVYGRDVNVTKYVNGRRLTLDPKRRATVKDVRKHLKDGCSFRVLCPQRYSDRLWRALSALEEHWGSGAGANVYLTPPGTQGFSPHYDEIEAFLMQTTGRKRWRVYAPRSEAEYLDRHSSPNYAQNEIGEPVMDVTLAPGDLLYMPRGTIHQGECLPGRDHSMHVTISTGLRSTWHDLLAEALPQALARASAENSALRHSLPAHYHEVAGLVNSDSADARRAAFEAQVREYAAAVLSYLPVDAAVDALAASYTHDRLPPPPPPAAAAEAAPSLSPDEITVRARIVPVRGRSSRLVAARDPESRQDVLALHFCHDNTRLYREKVPQSLLFPLGDGPALEAFVKSYPGGVRVRDLECDSDEDRVELAATLVDAGLARAVAE